MINMVKLSEVSDLTVGYVGPMGKEYVENGMLFLRSLNIEPFSFDLTDVKYITEDFNKTISKSILHCNDVVIVRTGIPGTAAVVPKEFDGCNCSDLVIVHPDTSKINPYYLCAFINSWGRLQVKNAKVGAIQKHFNVTEAKEMLIPLPDMEEQNLIANILRDINGKINLNNKIHSKLDSLLHSIYNYWFLQFEFPNADGEPYKTSGGKFVWNEKLKKNIPEGWNVKTINEMISTQAKSTIQVGQVEGTGDIPFFTSGVSILQSQTSLTNGLNCYLSTGGKANVTYYFGDASYSTDTWCISAKDDFKYVLPMMLSHLLPNMDRLYFAGTGLKHLQKDVFGMYAFPYPNNADVIKSFAEKTEDIYIKLGMVLRENLKLIKMRDYLVPMLMNGQVTFKEKA